MNPEQVEELIYRVEEMNKALTSMRETIAIQNQILEAQGVLNHIFNTNFEDTRNLLYGKRPISALGIEGEI